ncbi:neuronal acetylcholine receptor subunit beta-3-like isoform X1 [Biomphalaria glabrata]|uniref:Neuronal acetylcholine receptor subunit beta-3-like isoform X1 n=2 Tax=Biomphalaria glabrata TaxID=6526 RepID=A0A9W2YNP1_BIOGL|nr:neuronal acetylcholine receptor subunit beta-3-like isoform X1 [Biomphalaria glabrata]
MARIVVWSVCAHVLIHCHLSAGVGSQTLDLDGPEHQLYTNLFADYTPESRPVKNASHIVQVTFALSLNQLLDLDEKNQILSTSVWIYEEWKDEMLQWSPSDYEGQTAIMIPADNVWLPDIFIFNRAGTNMDGFVNVNGSKVAVQYDGTVRWMVPLMVSSVCAVDVTYFPYDRQACNIKFGSWIYDMEQVDVIIKSKLPDLEHYVVNSEYDLQNVSLTRSVLDSNCCAGGGRHPMVELRLELRRKSLYYDYIVIAPTIMLCVLTLASFLLPCDRGEKMAIGLTVFLTLYVLQLRIADNVPDTNSTPILGVFMLIVMTFNCVSLIMATIVMNIKKRGDECPCPNVPSWLFGVCHHVIGRIVCTSYFGSEPIGLPALQLDYHKRKTTNSQSRNSVGNKCASSRVGSAQRRDSIGQETIETEQSVADSKSVQRNAKRQAAGEASKVKHVTISDVTVTPRASFEHQQAPRVCYDPHKTPRPQSEGEIEMRLRKNRTSVTGSKIDVSVTPRLSSEVSDPGIGHSGSRSTDEVYMMKRRWFYVAEVVDKFLFLVYLVLLTTSIFTVLFLIPVYFRND